MVQYAGAARALCGCVAPDLQRFTRHGVLFPSRPEVGQQKYMPHDPLLGVQKMSSKGPPETGTALYPCFVSHYSREKSQATCSTTEVNGVCLYRPD